MKQVNPNLTDVLTARYISNLSQLRKLTRHWGTEVVDGIEVFKWRKEYYPDIDESTIKICKLLNIYDQVKGPQQGITSAWLTLSADKASDSTTVWNRTILTNNFNKAFSKDLDCSVVIGPKLVKRKQIVAPISTPISNQVAVLAEIKSKYVQMWRDGHALFVSEDDPYLAVLVMCILRCNDLPYEVVGVEETVSSTYLPSAQTMDGVANTDQVKAWRVRIKIPHTLILATSNLLDVLIQESTQPPATANHQLAERFKTAVGVGPDGPVDEETSVMYEGLPVTTGAYWYTKTRTFGDVKYLRTSLLTTTNLNTAEKLQYFLSCIDSGYQKKKAKWYEMVIAIIIIIVSIILAQPAGVQAGVVLLGMSAAYVAVVVIAVTVTVAALYISLAALALSHLGAQNVAASLSQFLRAVGPLVQIASVIAVIASIYSIIRKGAQDAAAEAARQGAETSLSRVASSVAGNVLETATGLTKLSSLTMAHVTKMLSFTFDVYQDMTSRDLQREVNNYRREIAALSQSKEKAETSDIVKELMASYANPLASDGSYYAELYDRPYEWWSTPYHTGNMQATTVNALWLNDPQNAILYNNSIGDT